MTEGDMDRFEEQQEQTFVERHGHVNEITVGTVLEYDGWQWALVTELAVDREEPKLGFILLDEAGDHIVQQLETANECRQHYEVAKHLRGGEHEYWAPVEYVLNDEIWSVLGPVHPEFRSDQGNELVTDGGQPVGRTGRLHRPPVQPDPVIVPMEQQHKDRVKSLWKGRFGAPDDTIDEWLADVFTEGKPTEGFVASDGGRVLGFGIACCCTPDYVEKYINHPDMEVEAWPKTGLLHIVCIDKEHEGRGIGSALVEQRIKWLISEGVDGILAVSWHRDNYRDSRPLLKKYLEPVATADDFYETAHDESHCVDCEGVCKCGATIFKRSLQPGTDR